MTTSPRPKLSGTLLKRPTAETRFSIDYDWWERSDLDLKTYLTTRLSLGDDVNLDLDVAEVDLIDSATGEVHRVDGFQYVVQSYFSQQSTDFVTRTSLVDAVFCVLLANANQPMSAQQIANRVDRAVDTILRTLSGPQVYLGIRPILEEE